MSGLIGLLSSSLEGSGHEKHPPLWYKKVHLRHCFHSWNKLASQGLWKCLETFWAVKHRGAGVLRGGRVEEGLRPLQGSCSATVLQCSHTKESFLTKVPGAPELDSPSSRCVCSFAHTGLPQTHSQGSLTA